MTCEYDYFLHDAEGERVPNEMQQTNTDRGDGDDDDDDETDDDNYLYARLCI